MPAPGGDPPPAGDASGHIQPRGAPRCRRRHWPDLTVDCPDSQSCRGAMYGGRTIEFRRLSGIANLESAMTSDDIPPRVQQLIDRQDILDCLMRYSRGVDRFDVD